MLHRSSSRAETVAAYSFVAAQVLLILILLVWHPAARWSVAPWLAAIAWVVGLAGAVWLVVGLLGLGRSLTALPLPVVHGELRTGGAFRFSRHPIYTGLLGLAWSAAVRSGAPGPLAVAALLTALLWVKSDFEEARLREAYPGYADYAAGVPRFLPLGRWGHRAGPRDR